MTSSTSATSVSGNQGNNLPPRRIYVLSTPRTASNLFAQMMSSHSNVANHGYEVARPAMWPTMQKFQTMSFGETSEEDKEEIRGFFQRAFNVLLGKLEQEEGEGKTLFVKEHLMALLDRRLVYEWSWGENIDRANSERWTEAENKRWTILLPGETEPRPRTNITMLPDDYLLTLLPIILIRHPALMMPSLYRSLSSTFEDFSLDKPMGVMMATFRWARLIYDWFVEKGVPAARALPTKEMQDAWPIVLDAEDTMKNKAVIDKLCRASGLDPAEVRYEWARKTDEELAKESKVAQMMGKTLFASSNVESHRAPENVDVEKENAKWIVEFGVEIAAEIRRLVDESMDDYDYLRLRKIRVD